MIYVTIVFHSPAALPYHSELSLWLSVDPLSDKYPSVSPYVYCAGNPVVMKDPNGRDIWEFDDNGNFTRVAESDCDEFYKVDYQGQRTGESLVFNRKVVSGELYVERSKHSSYFVQVENEDDACEIFDFMASSTINGGGEFVFAKTLGDGCFVGSDINAAAGKTYAIGNLLSHTTGYVFTDMCHNHYDSGCPSQFEPSDFDVDVAKKYPEIKFSILTNKGYIHYNGLTPPAKLCPEDHRNILPGIKVTPPINN